MTVHNIPGSLELIDAQTGPVLQYVPNPLFMDHRAPAGAIEVAIGEPEKNVSKTSGVDDVGIQKRSEPVHALLKVKLLIKIS